MQPIASSFVDPTYVVLNRLHVETLYLRTLCVLHRNYKSYGHDHSNPRFDYSYKTCNEAALKMLGYQAELYEACRPGGRFHQDRWVLSSLTYHEFLLAATILCLSLWEFHKRSGETSIEELQAQATKYDALKLSRDIWHEWKDMSADAPRAARVLAQMLSKVTRPDVATDVCSMESQVPDLLPSTANDANFMATAAANPTGNSSLGSSTLDTPGQQFPMDGFAPLDVNSTDPLGSVFGDYENIDWGLVDQYLMDTNNDDPVSLDW
ncbi:hypothetical protein MBLNU459_g2406t2 [Dothideomycetes sp. NU459]